ncbi:unnamed protein product [Adineta ricciae]|uniref:EF-hand domain-containing protein n=1 Tax=Adineta ricciae TaxID=249248 RepID=A0A814M5P4_ADIRI|nr:unnamed protein product [Adineta ricciae]
MGDDTTSNQRATVLRDAEIAILAANSKLNEREIRELYDEFLTADMSGTGRINKEQFCRYYKQLVGSEHGLDDIAKNVFTVFDVDHDGTIDFSEFVLANAIEMKNDPDSVLEFSFHMIDTSGDEHVNFDEIVAFVEKGLKLGITNEDKTIIDAKQITRDIFAMFGINKTQKLNKQQFVSGYEL